MFITNKYGAEVYSMGQKSGQKSRGNGEGNIRQKKDGRWEARVTIGYTEDEAMQTITDVFLEP